MIKMQVQTAVIPYEKRSCTSFPQVANLVEGILELESQRSLLSFKHDDKNIFFVFQKATSAELLGLGWTLKVTPELGGQVEIQSLENTARMEVWMQTEIGDKFLIEILFKNECIFYYGFVM